MGQEYSSLNKLPQAQNTTDARAGAVTVHEPIALPERLNLFGNEETERLCRKLQKHVALIAGIMPSVTCSACNRRGDLYLFPCDHVICLYVSFIALN